MTTITLTSSAPTKVRSDAIVVGVTKGASTRSGKSAGGAAAKPTVAVVAAGGMDEAAASDIAAALATLGVTGKVEEVTKVPANDLTRAPLVVAVGLGDHQADGAYDLEALRRAAGCAVRALAGTQSVAFALPSGSPAHVGAIAEGALLGAYAYTAYKSSNGAAPVAEITVVTDLARNKDAKAAVARAEVLAEAMTLCRNLINMPASDLTPAEFVRLAQDAAKGTGVRSQVLDEKALRTGGYGGLIGVGQGSVNPPRLLRMSYRAGRTAPSLALIGKGITFDSGGLSLKPGDGMVTMKCDMSGAAAVVSAVLALAKLNVPVNVTAWACLAENMPSGSAQRPSDVITIYGGKTVEVLNTDAEGRLVLADGLARAAEDKPDVMIDVATLTGACVVALGPRTSGILTPDDDLRTAIKSAADRAGDAMWPLPITEESRPALDSPIADIANVGERWGGALTAAAFLQEFVPSDRRWAHLDIAGPAFSAKPYGYSPKGGTGAAVRTLVTLAEDMAENTI